MRREQAEREPATVPASGLPIAGPRHSIAMRDMGMTYSIIEHEPIAHHTTM